MMINQNNSLILCHISKGMNATELLRVNKTFVEVVLKNNVTLTDVRYIDIVSQYDEAVQRGEKKTYIKAKLAELYGTSVRNIERTLKRMRRKIRL